MDENVADIDWNQYKGILHAARTLPHSHHCQFNEDWETSASLSSEQLAHLVYIDLLHFAPYLSKRRIYKIRA